MFWVRDLPLEATLKLVQIIDYMNKPVEIMQEEQETNHDKRVKIQKIYKNLKIINQHRQLIIDKKLKAIEKKQNTAHKALKLVRFLETNQQNPSKIQLTIFDLIKNNATNEIENNNIDNKEQLLLKYQLLKHEEIIINQNIQKLYEF